MRLEGGGTNPGPLKHIFIVKSFVYAGLGAGPSRKKTAHAVHIGYAWLSKRHLIIEVTHLNSALLNHLQIRRSVHAYME